MLVARPSWSPCTVYTISINNGVLVLDADFHSASRLCRSGDSSDYSALLAPSAVSSLGAGHHLISLIHLPPPPTKFLSPFSSAARLSIQSEYMFAPFLHVSHPVRLRHAVSSAPASLRLPMLHYCRSPSIAPSRCSTASIFALAPVALATAISIVIVIARSVAPCRPSSVRSSPSAPMSMNNPRLPALPCVLRPHRVGLAPLSVRLAVAPSLPRTFRLFPPAIRIRSMSRWRSSTAIPPARVAP
ncbi:hypothetical protein HYPSUDRAFT_1045736 [Hypholoma sublateritium FD-334 SS-4]|uniref:Uncharacterized protein n=1 Tax=Hypholoma sublateritium (strain FD-334 SS-4) TaxID=945553 RepID=A0A0D2KQT9_HYPSF|nr:hypothetical protein HYPSUDRAFT_1045736 [Hypholoma sublateritium FD-334 SS-4]